MRDDSHNKLEALQDADIYRELARLRSQIGGGSGGSFTPVTPTTQLPNQPQANNQLRNGSYAHSVGSWANVATADDRRYEGAFWFAHPDTANFALNTSDTTTTGLTATVVAATDIFTTATNTFLTADAVQLTTTTTLPAPLAVVTTYYIIYISTTTFKLATSVANAYAGTAIDITDTGTGTHTIKFTNYTLKSVTHALYNSSQTSWNRVTGVAQLNESWTLGAPLIQPTGEPSYVLFAAFNIAKKNIYVYAPVAARISSGMYGRQNGVWDYLYGAFTLTATSSGAYTTSRDYRVHVRTDRGFTIQSPTTTVATAPSDAEFSAGGRVVLSWPRPLQYGVLGYDIYRLTAGTYRLLDRVETGLTSYIDNGGFLTDAVAAYPSADYTKQYALTASRNSIIANLATDGVDANWDTLPFAIKVPANYNHGLLDFDRKQWVLWKLTGLTGGRLDVRVTDGVTNTTTTVTTTSSGQFNAGMVGKTINITAKEGTHTATINGVTDPNTLLLNFGQDVPFSSTNAELVVVGGADTNSIYIDLAHLSFGEGAIFGFHPEDLSPDRGVPPVAANGSNQGGTVILPGPRDGPGDGGPRCVWENEMITITDGSGEIYQVLGKDLKLGDYIFFQNEFAVVGSIEYGIADIWQIKTENGFTAHTSDTHKYLDAADDKQGLALGRKRVGDEIFTSIDGLGTVTKIKTREMVEKSGVVVKIGLSHSHRFLIGTWDDGVCRKWGGIGSENRKADEQINVV